MTLEIPENVFDESTMKSVVTCALLMSSIDGEVHEQEWNIIQSFIDRHWKEDYQDFSAFKKMMEKEIASVFHDMDSFQNRLDILVEKLTIDLSSDQKNILLNLVGEVMIADGIMTLEESKLFATFMDKLGIRIS